MTLLRLVGGPVDGGEITVHNDDIPTVFYLMLGTDQNTIHQYSSCGNFNEDGSIFLRYKYDKGLTVAQYKEISGNMDNGEANL
jgi:hypothetical protein